MGTKARQIVKMDVDELVALLNSAFADEWLAYYQYWLGAKVIKGPMKGAVEAELVEHAGEELNHAEMLATRILQLGGTPLISPEEWYKVTKCGYEKPEDEFVKTILAQNIKGEQCAIEVYQKILEIVKDKDPVTYNMALFILEEELKHEEELQALEEDLDLMIQRKS